MGRKNIMEIEAETHESYGLLQLSRTTCTPPHSLFGSSVKHGNLIALRVYSARKYRDYQSDNYGKKELQCEIFLSPTQFAEAITSLNIGSGTPCTIKMVKGDEWDENKRGFRDDCPEVNFRKQTNDELNDELSKLGDRISTLAKSADELLGQKGALKVSDKNKLADELGKVMQELRSNIPFVHQCFNRSVNKAVTEAKGEIDATYQSLREKLGDKAIAEGIKKPLLD